MAQESAAPKAAYPTPLLNVNSIEASISFYELIGFKVIRTEGSNPYVWARLECDGGALMFLRNEAPLSAPKNGIRLYMYTPDLAALLKHLKANGIEASPVEFPGYMSSGEARVMDPDGNLVFLGHWGKKEQEKWEAHLRKKA